MRRTRQKQKGVGGHLSDTNLLLVLVVGGGGSPQPRVSIPADPAGSALSSSPDQRKRAASSRSGRQPRGGFARVLGAGSGRTSDPRPRAPRPPPLLACFRDARLRLSARGDGALSLLATCCHSNPPGGSQRRRSTIPATEKSGGKHQIYTEFHNFVDGF